MEAIKGINAVKGVKGDECIRRRTFGSSEKACQASASWRIWIRLGSPMLE